MWRRAGSGCPPASFMIYFFFPVFRPDQDVLSLAVGDFDFRLAVRVVEFDAVAGFRLPCVVVGNIPLRVAGLGLVPRTRRLLFLFVRHVRRLGLILRRRPPDADPDGPVRVTLLELEPDGRSLFGDGKEPRAGIPAVRHARERPVQDFIPEHLRALAFQASPVFRVLVVLDDPAIFPDKRRHV